MRRVSAERQASSLRALGLCFILCTFLTAGGCQKKITVQRRTDLLEQAEISFRSADYAEAARLFEVCLRSNLSQEGRERALFQLGLAHLFPDSPIYDPQVACNLLTQVAEQVPEGPLKPSAKIILASQGELHDLRSKVQEIEKEMETWRTHAAKLQDELQGLTVQLETLSSESQVLQSHLKLRQTRIEALLRDLDRETIQRNELQAKLEQLQKEMEGLKQIDLRGKRPE